MLDDDGKKQRFRKVIVKHQLMAESGEVAEAAADEDHSHSRNKSGKEADGAKSGNRRPKAWSKSKLRIEEIDLRLVYQKGVLYEEDFGKIQTFTVGHNRIENLPAILYG